MGQMWLVWSLIYSLLFDLISSEKEKKRFPKQLGE